MERTVKMWISDNNPNQYSSYGNELPANTGDNGMAYPEMAMYPSMYYIMQPHIMMVCDHMDMCSNMMPPAHMMMYMCDEVCDRVLKMHPEMAQYDTPYPAGMMPDPPYGIEQQYGRFRRRTPFRDLAFFLLLAELFRRRRRY